MLWMNCYFTSEVIVKTIWIRYGAILFFILLLSSLWEFSIKGILHQYWTLRSIPGRFSEHIESVVTIFIFCFVSLLYPYFHTRKEVRKRTRYKLDIGCLTPHLHKVSTERQQLPEMITICSWCKKIHEDSDIWTQLETYLYEHSDATLSHGLCPDCFKIQLSQIEKFE